jgi:hypothetical protein
MALLHSAGEMERRFKAGLDELQDILVVLASEWSISSAIL